MKRVVYHVTPDGELWRVKRVGAARAAAVCAGKSEAIARAKELAKRGTMGQVRVHRADGEIQTEYTYGEDPHRRKG